MDELTVKQRTLLFKKSHNRRFIQTTAVETNIYSKQQQDKSWVFPPLPELKLWKVLMENKGVSIID